MTNVCKENLILGGLSSLTAFDGAILPSRAIRSYSSQIQSCKERFTLNCEQINTCIGSLQVNFGTLNITGEE